MCGLNVILGVKWASFKSQVSTSSVNAHQMYPTKSWPERILRGKFSLAARIACKENHWPAPCSRWQPGHLCETNFHVQPRRRPGRPPKPWDDQLRAFSKGFSNIWNPLCTSGIRWQVRPASIQHLTVQVHVDADHAGCLETARSTSGWNVFVTYGHGMCALVDWASKRQAATARSTGEAEVVAGADCVQSTFPMAAVLEESVSQQLPFQLCTDSNSVRTAFVNGYSRKLRYIKKNQRVCLGFASDSLERTGGEAARADSGDNTADMHTKPLPRVAFTKLRSEMGVVAICNGTM